MRNTDNEERIAFKLKLEGLIQQYLEMCNVSNTPYLCKHIQTEEGYNEVVEFCVKMFIMNNMSIGDALVQKENILNPNYLTD